MRFLFHIFALASALVAVIACESECQVGVCDAFTARYLPVVHKSLQILAKEMVTELLPPQCYPRHLPIDLSTVLETYNQTAPQSICQFVFKYFHGKCLDSKGIEPQGCPDPDCPIVCGTSGSLCRHYSTLAEMVHLNVAGLVETLLQHPGVADKVAETIERLIRRCPQARRTSLGEVKRTVKRTFGTFRQVLRALCGVNLNKCKWEKPMKKYILGFH